MDFKQIDAFVNVAKYKSFSKAAEAIYLSQPTVSAHVASLEEELRTTLFDRTGKEVSLTHTGKRFLEYAINMLNTRNDAIHSLSEIDSKISGKLIIASSTTPCRFVLPQLLKEYNIHFQEVYFDIKEESTKKVTDMILNATADIGIVGEASHDPRLTFTKICEDKLTMISNNALLPENLDLSVLEVQQFILREEGSATRHKFEEYLHSNNMQLSKLKIFAEVSSLEAVLQFVKTGVGLSFVSELACSDYINAGLIRKHTVTGLDVNRGIYIVTHNKRLLTPAAREFIKIAETSFINTN